MGAVLGLLGVAAGAFGAHGLQDSVDARGIEIWKTGAHYQQLHAVVLVAIGLGARTSSRPLGIATTLLTLGVVLFSGSLYAMALGAPKVLGAVAPVGGLCFMAGWAALALHSLSGSRTEP